MTLSTVLEGVALTLLGDAETGLSMTDKGIELYQGITAPNMFWPLILQLRGLVHSYSGHPDRGQALIDEAVALVGLDDFPISGSVAAMSCVRCGPQTSKGPKRGIGMPSRPRMRNDCGHMSCGLSVTRSRKGFEEHALAKARTVLGLDPVGATSPR
ncbi:MAG: hypothetical protein ACRDX9_14295 [Acidimicrobiia bacterium]